MSKTRFDVPRLDGYHPEIGLLLAALEDSTREWRGELGELPDEAMIWRARKGGHSIGALILHMADVEAYWFETYVAGMERPAGEEELLMSSQTNQDAGDWPAPHAEPQEWYYALHDRVRSRARGALNGQDPERWIESGEYGETVRWVVAHVLEHDAYHGGQAVLLADLWRAAR